MLLDNKKITINGGLIKTARLKDEWYEDIEDPAPLINEIKRSKYKPDIFTFWQRLPETTPKYNYYSEWESIAVIPIKDYDYWWKKQINAKTRNMVRKADKKGVKIKLADFNDEFVKGMRNIFNESPIRQGKPFWHYGKNLETLKKEFSRNLHREDILGAYFNDELIGYIMLAYAGKFAMTTQIVSMIKHRDKAPNNALLAEAIKICDKKKLPYLVYAMWVSGTLGKFKRSNGFERIDLPRYYIPLTAKGKIALNLHLHHGYVGILPERMLKYLIDVRNWWYAKKNTAKKPK
ncbi:MAG: hypothetical protein C4B58_13920 [Deltaproteobacteria bacterium]|nr:MAG: hypothetical protein C4B58_13920 [Deltaproteobacteria bacterium]